MLRKFLGMRLGQDSPDHSSLSYIRNRLPLKVRQDVFVWILALAEKKKLLKGKTVAVDSTTLEANAAMKSIVLQLESALIHEQDDSFPPAPFFSRPPFRTKSRQADLGA